LGRGVQIKTIKTFSIVGAGRLGTVLGSALVRRGWQVEVIVDINARAARGSRRIIGRGRVSTSLAAAARTRGMVIIAVPDDAIAAVASALARSGGLWAGRDIVHTSGLLPARILAPLAERGARVASLHPVQAFPRKDAPASIFKGITWGIEGDPTAIETAEEIVRMLRGNVLLLSENDKPLYHAACTLASNALIALEWTAADVLRRTGVSEEAASATLFPLLQGTLQNVKSLGLEKSLTGPILRGDVATVHKHLEALGGDAATSQVYKVLGKQTLRLAAKSGLSAGCVRALKRLLEGK
jgi:predicted short-subunit dehydrogenase-like oxidoreductase (DUF2520 family)